MFTEPISHFTFHISHPMLMCDFYKISHRAMYPPKTQYVYSTWTPRHSRQGLKDVVVFGHNAFVQKMNHLFDEYFFNENIGFLINRYRAFIKSTLGDSKPYTKHIEELHELGYLPLKIQSLPEGILVPIRTPVLTIENTHPDFFWLTNYIESFASCELWQASTSATIAHQFRTLLDRYALETVGNTNFVPYQGHDFSLRGMSSIDSAVSSGMGHLLSFRGSDNIPAIEAAHYHYEADLSDGKTGTSIPASEHSVQCAYQDDYQYLKRLITEVHPTGMVSIVADGYDFWYLLNNILPMLKTEIMARDGKVVIRPDSGDPVKIVCGDEFNILASTAERLGAIAILASIFGCTVNDKGYKELDSHIGLIYGDAITLERADNICYKLKTHGYASTNIVFGIGSYTYQYNTRDTFGYALKSTSCTIDGVQKPIFKSPKTDDGIKTSQMGRVHVFKVEFTGDIVWMDESNTLTPEQELKYKPILETIYEDGSFIDEATPDFETIRNRLTDEREKHLRLTRTIP